MNIVQRLTKIRKASFWIWGFWRRVHRWFGRPGIGRCSKKKLHHACDGFSTNNLWWSIKKVKQSRCVAKIDLIFSACAQSIAIALEVFVWHCQIWTVRGMLIAWSGGIPRSRMSERGRSYKPIPLASPRKRRFVGYQYIIGVPKSTVLLSTFYAMEDIRKWLWLLRTTFHSKRFR